MKKRTQINQERAQNRVKTAAQTTTDSLASLGAVERNKIKNKVKLEKIIPPSKNERSIKMLTPKKTAHHDGRDRSADTDRQST